MRITVVGGGNIGTQFAVHGAESGNDVTVYTSEPYLFERELCTVDENNVITHRGVISQATNNPIEAFKKAELIVVTFPPSMMKDIAELIFLYANPSAYICVVPGNGGGECAFKKCIERGNIFFGIERVPAIARLIQKGKCVKSTGYRTELHVASIPKRFVKECARIVEGIFGIDTLTIPSFLNLTMTPSNPILHTTRLKTIFFDWYEGMTYSSLPLFYEDWNDASSELLFSCDEEVQRICCALPEIPLQYVKSLRIHYESPTIKDLTRKISSIPAFKGLKTPCVDIGGAYIPDLHSRYFTADFSYGLATIKQIGEFAGIDTPFIDSTISWYKKIAIETDEFSFRSYGINCRKDLVSFYLQ